MDSYDQITVGCKAEFYLKNTSKFDDKTRYRTQVLSKRDDCKVVTIFNPGFLNSDENPADSLYQFIFFTAVGNITCDGSIQRFYDADGERRADVRISSAVQKSSLRSSDRYDCYMPIKYSSLHVAEHYTDDPDQLFDGVALNISGGGMKIVCDSDYQENIRLRVILLKRRGAIWTEGTIVNKKFIKSSLSEYNYEYGVKFITKSVCHRKSIRIKCSFPLRFAVYDKSYRFYEEFIPTDLTVFGVTVNMSEGGVMFISPAGLLMGTFLNMIIDRPDGPLSVQGVVVRNSLKTENGEFKTNVKYTRLIM